MLASAALIFTVVWLVVVAFPCICIGFLGFKLMANLGRYPSKTPAIQTKMILPLLIIEIVSVTLLITVFKILAD